MTTRGAYDARTQAVVYGCDDTADFTREDWINLAMAALDQAGCNVRFQEEIRASLVDEIDDNACGEGG